MTKKTIKAWSYTWSEGGLEYISIGKGLPHQTKVLRKGLILDLDKDQNIIGVEILSAPPISLPSPKKRKK